MKKLFLLVIVMSLLMSSCGSKLYLNPNYEFQSPSRELKLALIPTPGGDGPLMDSLFTFMFDDSLTSTVLIKPKMIRRDIVQNIMSPNEFLSILNRLWLLEYSKDELKAGVLLQNTLTDSEFELFKSKLGNPDFVMMPVIVNLKSLGMVTSGFSKMRLFDLRSGSLIYENSMDLNVQLGGDDGKTYLAIGLAGFAKADYNKYFWQKYVKE